MVGASAAVFALQNVDPVVIRFLGWRIEGAPLALVIMVSVLAGIVLTAGFTWLEGKLVPWTKD